MSIKIYKFEKIVLLTRNHFEIEGNKKECLILWRTTTLLLSVKKENTEKGHYIHKHIFNFMDEKKKKNFRKILCGHIRSCQLVLKY